MLLLSLHCVAQQQAANWYFGYNAGIKFDAAGNVTALTDGQLSTSEGCATLSDTNGNLQLYTDGVTVFNKNHQIMANGTGLMGDSSTTQSATIVPLSGSATLFYLFTLDAFAGANGFRYSIIDMALNGGLGAVTSAKNILIYTPTSEKIAVVKHANGIDYWIVTHGWNNTIFYSYLLTSAGLSSIPVTSSIGTLITGIAENVWGQMKISPDGTKIAVCNALQNLELYDFNTSTGTLSNVLLLENADQANDGFNYGTEFSPDNSKLYFSISNFNSAPSTIVQYNLQASNIIASRTIIFTSPIDKIPAAMQIGPNNKIYVVIALQSKLSVINNPNNLGASCNFQTNAVDLAGRSVFLGLPSFVSSYFYNPSIQVNNTCQNQTVLFQVTNTQNGSGITWDFGDNTTGAGSNPTHTYANAGTYTVTVTVTNSNGVLTNAQVITILAEPILLNPIITLKQCDDNTDGFSVFNLNQAKNSLVSSQNGLLFSFHETYNDALNDAAPIVNIMQYINQTASTDIIYVRVQNQNDCFKTAQINLVVSTTQIPNTFLRTLQQCDNVSSGSNIDGISNFNFASVKQDVLNLFPANQLLDVSFYQNLSDALSQINAITNISNYSNITSPYQQNIWIRVNSQTNNDCLGLGQHLQLVVERIPIIQNLTLTTCDDNNDGYFEFNTLNLENNLLDGIANAALSYTDQNNNPVVMTNPFITNNKTLNVKIKNTYGNQCEYNSTLTFVVSALPQFNPLTTTLTTACDDEINPEFQNGTFAFDTTNFENLLLGTQANMSIKYYDQSNNPIVLTNPFISGTQNIKVEITNLQNNACKAFGQLSFIVNPIPNISLLGTELVCSNNVNFTKIIDAGLNNPSTINDYTYKWYFNNTLLPIQTNYNLTVNAAGIYKAIVTNAYGCNRTRIIAVSASEIASIDSIVVTDLTENNIVVINASGLGSYEYSLDGIFYQESNKFENINPGIYTVFIRDKKACGISVSEINVLGIPKFFTPNGDNYNDSWNLIGINQNVSSSVKIRIFDRFGKLVHQLDTLSQGWDGTLNSQPLPSDDYWYVISFDEGRILKGHFSLKR